MKALRLAVLALTVTLLAGGYLVSTFAYFFGDPAAYSAALDASPVPALSLVLLAALVALAFVPNPEEPT
ncbi:MAG: hypothetical protein KF884_00500 [Fimbriimonadaceae bacterium]|nr:hypothetical protein [Fimbriimonadaceae bacterium]QYK58575.1 MAG: hypothetical protein KF884_00500 [Fimbriimonadaceae bacterium]